MHATVSVKDVKVREECQMFTGLEAPEEGEGSMLAFLF